MHATVALPFKARAGPNQITHTYRCANMLVHDPNELFACWCSLLEDK